MNPLPRTALLLGSLTAPALAQRSAQAIQSDMDFARELAARFQYVDLSVSILERLEKEKLDDRQRESLSLVQCQVFTESARREGDVKRRLELFDQAAQAYRRFLEQHARSDLAQEAERSYLTLVNNYGRALESALAEAMGDEAQALRERTKLVLEDGLKRTGDLKDAFDRPGLNAAEKLDKWRLMLDRAQMLLTLGNVSPDPEFLFIQAEGELEKVAIEAGETSAPGLNAFLVLAKVKRARGDLRGAADFAEFVIMRAVPEDASGEEWRELPFEVRAERFKLVELALPDLLESLKQAGEMEKATKWALYFYNAWKREGFDISPLGYVALLSAARTLLDAGGYVGGNMQQGSMRWFESEEAMNSAGFSGRDARSSLDLALKTAQDVNTENRGNTLQVRAQKLISDVIDRPGLSVSPDVLFEAAQGDYNTKNHVKALEAFRSILRSLDGRDDATRRQYSPKVLFYLASSLKQLQRPLEAAMAFREGATTWSGDPEYQERLAQGFYSTINEVRGGAAGDPLIEQLYLQAEQLVIDAKKESGGADTITWRQAERAYDEKDYAGARQRYLAVGEAGDEYEKALVKAALCLYKAKDLQGATGEFRRYLEQFVPDPKHAITGAKKKAARAEASAMATFYLGRMAYDAQEWDDVIRWLGGYPERFSDQTDYGPNAQFMLIGAQIAKKDLAGARVTCADMEQRYPGNATTGKAALALFSALKSEQEAAVAAGDQERARSLKGEMARNMQLANSTASQPAFANLRLESSLWLEAGEYAAAEKALRTTVQKFQGKPEQAADLERFVLPDLGAALLGQKRLPEAFQVLDPLIPKEASDTRKPSSALVRDWTRSVVGWIEGEANQVTAVPGVGGEANFKLAVELLGKLLDQEKALKDQPGRGDWSCPWYQLKFEQCYALYLWGEVDSSQKQVARRLLEDLRGQLGDPELKAVATECGNDVLRRHFLWLGNQLK